jgi:protoheme IX farnesyltransferase
MFLASPGMVPLPALIFGTIGIAMASGSAAAFNHALDRRIDERMARTRRRPLPRGHLLKRQAMVFAALMGMASMLVPANYALYDLVGRVYGATVLGLHLSVRFCRRP